MSADESDTHDLETVFESFFDRDSGVWSLRRVPTSPPPARLGDLGSPPSPSRVNEGE